MRAFIALLVFMLASAGCSSSEPETTPIPTPVFVGTFCLRTMQQHGPSGRIDDSARVLAACNSIAEVLAAAQQARSDLHLDGIEVTCDPIAEQRGFTPDGFGRTNGVCREFFRVCADRDGKATRKCYGRFANVRPHV